MPKLSLSISVFIIVCLLLTFGMLMVYDTSASLGVRPYRPNQEESKKLVRLPQLEEVVRPYHSFFFLKRQMLWVALGLIIMFILWRLDYRHLQTVSLPLLGFSLLLLVLVLVIGKRHGGAVRGFYLGPLRFQPSELAKLSIIVFIAYYLHKLYPDQLRSFRHTFIPVGVILGVVAALLLMEPDFGSTVIIGCIGLVMLFAAGVRRLHLGVVLIPAICLLCLAIVTSTYRMNRVRAQWDIIMGKEQLIETVSYQTRQSLIAMGSGGLWGQGLGEGLQKYHFLSLAHSDFIFPIIGEESGFFGAMFVALLFLALFVAGMRITFSCPDRFTQLLALGVTLLLSITALIHMMVAVALLPPKGLPLPFISYGGSAMLVNLAAVGILMNLAQYSDVKL